MDSSVVTLGCPAKLSGSSGKRQSEAKKKIAVFENHLDEAPEVYDLFNVPGTSFHLPDT